MSVQEVKEFACWPISRNWIRRWTKTIELVVAILISIELASKVMIGLVGILLLIKTFVLKSVTDQGFGDAFDYLELTIR